MKKILIVDDAQFMQKVTSGMLSHKYETICAASGEEALELYEREKPDMILTDLVMPGMTGLELQRILQERYHDNVPIMFMTADDNDENESRGLEGGAMDYIRKPFKQELLLRRVDNVIRHVQRMENLRAVAETDPMTGLLNKANAQRALTEICRRANGVLMMIDLDSFKLVNDIHGHGMGDKILISFSEIIRGVIRGGDIAGRMGGDEFIAFCQDIRDEAVIEAKTRQINEELLESARNLMGPDMNIPLGASIGAVLVPDEGRDYAALSEKADRALYRVKQNGKHGCAFYHGDDPQEAPEDTFSMENIRMILEERNRQKGPYELGQENFQCIYRYLVRLSENYRRRAELIVFSLDGAEEDASEAFGDALRASLRRSDIFTQSGRAQYMALLSEADGENSAQILQRVLTHWEASGKQGSASVQIDTALIE